MSRTVRMVVGAVVAGTLAFVALVAGVMSAAPGPGLFAGFEDMGPSSLDTAATAEVLDVDEDEEWGWPTVDVRWTTADGEVVVTYVDWEWSDDLPVVGDRVDIVFDASDPEYAFAADDPWVGDFVAGPDGGTAAATDGEDTAAGSSEDVGGVAGWVSLGALLGLLVTVGVTVVAAVRAPSPAVPPWGEAPGPPLGPSPYLIPQPPHQYLQPHQYPPPQQYPHQHQPPQQYPHQHQPPQQYPHQHQPPPARPAQSPQAQPPGPSPAGGQGAWSSP